MRYRSAFVQVLGLAALSAPILAQTPAAPPPAPARPPETVWRELPLVDRFDRDGDKRLDTAERADAREYLRTHPELKPASRSGRMGPGSPGPGVSPAEVTSYPATTPLYDEGALRTLFLQFDEPDWERELVPFHFTDVDVPATLSVDGVSYPGTGVHFRGHNSFIGVVNGRKRPLGLSPDFVNPAQRLLGYRGLHLHNAYQDPSFVRGVLFLHIARTYLPAPKANFVRVVVNGESWGVYVNHQRFDTDFLRDHFGTTQGTRWRSLNNAQGGGLSYLGEDVAAYKEAYEIKSKDDPKAWAALIALCRALNQTPPDQLTRTLDPILDVEGALRYLALDNALMNGDGYWEDGSDYNLYLDPKGRFHLVSYDVNEAFRPIGGGRATGPGRGAALDPLAGAEEPRKALLHKLLAAPDLRERYLRQLREIAGTWLDWTRLSPIVERYRALIADDVARDPRKVYTTEEFAGSFTADSAAATPLMTLKGFVDARRAFLLGQPQAQPSPPMPPDYQAVLTALGKTGDYKDSVFKVNLPRPDLKVTIAGRPAPTPFGFGGWVAFTKGDGGQDVMMGDLVLTEDEVSPVMSALLGQGLDVTALHNHFFWEQPRVFYMHVHGMGTTAALAKQLKPAIDLIDAAVKRAPPPGPPPALQLNAERLSTIIGAPGETNGAVYKITIGRPDIDLRAHGARITARMGLNTWAAFTGTDADAMVAGDVAVKDNELTPVLAALRKHGIDIVAIHHHMTGVQPTVIFLHYFGRGRAEGLAEAVRAALDLTGRR